MTPTRSLRALAALAFTLLTLVGCAGLGHRREGESPGETLYFDRCANCHDAFHPAAYSDAQWIGVMSRMQGEAQLSDDDALAVLRWLQANN